MRWKWFWIAVCIGTIAVVGAGWWRVGEQRYRRELAQAEKDMAGGRYRPARDLLAALRRRRPGSSEAAYRLGLCEENLGHAEAAMTAWSGVAADSPLYVRTSVARARLLMNTGKLSLAEELLVSVPRGRNPGAMQVGQVLEHLLRLEGRIQESRGVIVESWRGVADPSYVLKRLYILEDSAFPIDYVKKSLDSCDQQDDRVWLGYANLAMWSGRFDEADRWLDACVKRRPDDQPVWLARLALATASRDLAGVRQAVQHVWASWFLPFEVLRLRAWHANFRGDDAAKRETLLALLAEEPGNNAAWGRLAELTMKAGRGTEAETFQKVQGEMSVLRERYIHLFMLDDRSRHVEELSRIVRELGRPIEARGWSLIYEGRAASEPLWPDKTTVEQRAPATQMLVSKLEDLLPSASPGRSLASAVKAPILPEFTDDSAEAGLRFYHDNGHTGGTASLPQTMCGGVGLLDYYADGWPDIYAVQSGPFPPTDSAAGEGDRLFHNRGDGTFEDASERTGVASFPRGYGHGVTVGDFDNDGYPDVFVTRWNSYALYRNRGDGRFEDVTSKTGLGNDRDWPTSAAFADLDGDGDLDLYVCHYLFYDPSNPRVCPHADSPSDHTCMPRDYASLADRIAIRPEKIYTKMIRRPES
jgi:enediyne biosynthesis protein E4